MLFVHQGSANVKMTVEDADGNSQTVLVDRILQKITETPAKDKQSATFKSYTVAGTRTAGGNPTE